MLGIAGEVRMGLCGVLLWTSTRGHTSVGRPAKIYIDLLYADTGCSQEDQPRAKDDRDGWRERIRELNAIGTT